ncbi:HPr kinase [Novosphingobium barchaimii LL02]|uniref:HPr kinase n=1 Tax=Novosphingobium barchaimii LL02 TaxID=1114963 RepID=A0A0J7Y6X5_9SPHN|nr:HPr kinase/phosphatase C-terminal domain-containing protein [Novosphingobium barchaimii]KMS59571.1 HPr kinase [Novosphingobium barchaimii LL02]
MSRPAPATAPAQRQSTCIAIAGRAVLIEGPPGSGKSSLALALIDRGAELIGDDSVLFKADGRRLIAMPHPHTRGLMEVRNLGVLPFPCIDDVPVALVLRLDSAAPRYIETPERFTIAGIELPLVRLWPEGGSLALKAELALGRYGLAP